MSTSPWLKALPSIVSRPPEEEAVAALVRLAADPDSDVRDWATFGLGSQLDVDTYAVREALVAGLADKAGNTAGEALVGLARRHDPRTLLPLLARLEDDPGNLIVDAARELGAPDALAALLRLKEEGWQDDGPEVSSPRRSHPSVLEAKMNRAARHARRRLRPWVSRRLIEDLVAGKTVGEGRDRGRNVSRGHRIAYRRGEPLHRAGVTVGRRIRGQGEVVADTRRIPNGEALIGDVLEQRVAPDDRDPRRHRRGRRERRVDRHGCPTVERQQPSGRLLRCNPAMDLRDRRDQDVGRR